MQLPLAIIPIPTRLLSLPFRVRCSFSVRQALTKVYGAQSNDKVEVNGGALGNNWCQKERCQPGTTLSSFINAVVGDPTKGHTYIGNNGTTTFIETDTDGGHVGAVEIVGAFTHSTISNHVLTLHA